MALLREVDPTVYLKRIERIYGGFPNLGNNTQEPTSHFDTYYNFRTTLTHVTVNYAQEEDVISTLGGDQIGDVLELLPHFEHLTHLKLAQQLVM